MNFPRHKKIKPSLIALAFCFTFSPLPSRASQSAIEAIKENWPVKYASTAIRIAQRESKLTPSVQGCGGRCVGLFQIVYPAHRHWLATLGITQASDLKDATLNSKAAYHLFKLSGSNWSPWCHPSGFPTRC